MPVSAKDLILTKGLRTAFASLTMKDNVPASDAASEATPSIRSPSLART